MANFKCVPCRARVWREREPTDLPGDLCPGCGGPLEPVSAAAELIGLRSLRSRPRPPARVSSQRVADEIRATIARHDREREGP